MSTRVITVCDAKDSSHSIADAATEGAAALRKGKLVGFATETVYGIAALATNKSAMQRLREIKSRPSAPFSVHVATAEEVTKYVENVPLRAQWLMDRTWPGPVTLLLETSGKFPSKRLSKIPDLHDELTLKGFIGLRCPDEPVARAMLSQVPGPVVAPSANLTGAPSPHTADEVLHALNGEIDLLIDSGQARFSKDSSIVRFRGNEWELVRKGVLDERMVGKCMKRKIAFVCTGNTCRSPLAAGLAKKFLAERMGCGGGKLRENGVEVISAGLFAGPESKATPEAIHAAAAKGADISRHRSKKITSELIKSCDLIFCMTEFHLKETKRLAGNSPTLIYLLDEQHDVPDPIGGNLDVYEKTAEHIEQALLERIAKGLL